MFIDRMLEVGTSDALRCYQEEKDCLEQYGDHGVTDAPKRITSFQQKLPGLSRSKNYRRYRFEDSRLNTSGPPTMISI